MSLLPQEQLNPGPNDSPVSVHADISLRRQLAGILMTYGETVYKFGISPDSPPWARKLHEQMRHPDPGCWIVERSHRKGQPEEWVGRLIWSGYRQDIPPYWNREREGPFLEPAKMTYIVQNLAGYIVTWTDADILWVPETMVDVDAFFATQPNVASQAHAARIARGEPWAKAMLAPYEEEIA